MAATRSSSPRTAPLRAKVDELIARIDRVAAATEMSARLMDRVTANGNAMRTEAA